MRCIYLKYLFLTLIFAFSMTGVYDCYAQSYAKGKKAGAKTKRQYPALFKSKKSKGQSHHKSYITIYKTTAAEAYSGNPCAQKAANSMGFQYMLHYANCEKAHSKSNNFLHNQAAYIAIIFRNGPFWKYRFKKRTNECRS